MNRLLKKYGVWCGVLPLAASPFLLSCSGSVDDDAMKMPAMTVGFRVIAPSGAGSLSSGQVPDANGDYETGEDRENMIDVAGKDYAVYFYDSNDNYITRFRPNKIDMKPVEDTHYVDYTVTGDVPSVLTTYPDFKIVVLANALNGGSATNYPDVSLGTTIAELTCPSPDYKDIQNKDVSSGYEKYSIGDDFTERLTDGDKQSRFIPMYGVKEYKGVKYEESASNPGKFEIKGENGSDFGPITMLRAMAKVEVIFRIDGNADFGDYDYSIDYDGLSIENYNASGYCFPENVTRQEDYDHGWKDGINNGNWSEDYWKGNLHLVGGANDDGIKSLKMKKVAERERDENNDKRNKVDEKWVAYIAEYRNVPATTASSDCSKVSGVGNNPVACRIKFKINGIEKNIEFRMHKDGEPTGEAFNVERNNLYRFIVTHIDERRLTLKVETRKWNDIRHEDITI